MESQKEEHIDKKEQNTSENQPVKTEPKIDTQQSNSSPKASKTRKIVYLNQKVYFPMNIPDKIDFIYNLFYNDELGYVINSAPLCKSATIYEIGKYFKIKLKYILEIASGILYYIFKNFHNSNSIPRILYSSDIRKLMRNTPENALYISVISFLISFESFIKVLYNSTIFLTLP